MKTWIVSSLFKRGNYSRVETIQGWKLFKRGNYSQKYDTYLKVSQFINCVLFYILLQFFNELQQKQHAAHKQRHLYLLSCKAIILICSFFPFSAIMHLFFRQYPKYPVPLICSYVRGSTFVEHQASPFSLSSVVQP